MKILIAGDYSPRSRVRTIIEESEFDKVFQGVKGVVEDADYSIVNFECAITGEKSLGISKSGPCLSATPKSVDALKWCGFNCVTLANNHFRDFGDEGVHNTIEALKSKGIDYVGGGRSFEQASETLYKNVDGINLAIINACEEEFSIATENSGGSNLLNPVKQFYSIQEAKQKSDYVIVILHGGHEHYQLPSPRMKELYRFFVDAGADVVVNHHQHCYSGYEIYKGKPIIYGLGNFCFDHELKRDTIWNEGYMVKLKLENNDISFVLIPYKQCDSEADVQLMGIDERKEFDNHISLLNDIIKDDIKLKDSYNKFVQKQRRNYRYLFTPWDNKYTIALFNRGVLPFGSSRAKMLVLYNYLVCPAHRDNLIHLLKEHLFDNK